MSSSDPDDAPRPATAAERPPGSARHRFVDFTRRVIKKAEEDNIFFMAGAISFNVIVAFVPLLLFVVGVSGIVLSARFGDPSQALLDVLQRGLPAIRGEVDLVDTVRRQIAGILDQRRNLTLLGALLLVWFSTRLVGTLRTCLREIFDVSQDRGVVLGKIFDIQMVLAGGALFTLNLGVTAVVQAVESYGIELVGLEGPALGWVHTGVARMVAFVSAWVLFLAVYRYLPARTLPWKPALIAATFMAVFHELLKTGFGWYVTDVANYRTTYGNLLTLAILFFWIYYEAIVFILGGEVAQVWTMRRARRLRTRHALFGGGT